MPQTAAVDRPDSRTWRAYRALVDAETAALQMAVFRCELEGEAAPAYSFTRADYRRPHRRGPYRLRRVLRPGIRRHPSSAHLHRGRRRGRDERAGHPGHADCRGPGLPHRCRGACCRQKFSPGIGQLGLGSVATKDQRGRLGVFSDWQFLHCAPIDQE